MSMSIPEDGRNRSTRRLVFTPPVRPDGTFSAPQKWLVHYAKLTAATSDAFYGTTPKNKSDLEDGKGTFQWDEIVVLDANKPVYYASNTPLVDCKYATAALLVKALEYTNEPTSNSSAHDAGIYHGRFSLGD